MYNDPQDEIPRTHVGAGPQKPKRRKGIGIAIGVVLALILGFLLGHMTAGTKTVSDRVIVYQTVTPTPSPVDPATSPTDTTSPTDGGSGTATDTSSASATASDPSGSNATTAQYLSQLQPVDGGGALRSPEDETISGVDYPNSIQQNDDNGNGTTTVWDAEHFSTFTAEVGVDDSTSADGETVRVVFLNQAGVQLGSVQVAVGAPQRVTIALKGAVHFEIECMAEGNQNPIPVTFGNAQFVP